MYKFCSNVELLVIYQQSYNSGNPISLVLFVEMGYFDLNRHVFPWFFLKMVREHEEASVSLVLS